MRTQVDSLLIDFFAGDAHPADLARVAGRCTRKQSGADAAGMTVEGTAAAAAANSRAMINECHRALWRLKDPSSLAITRILFGLLMALDVHFERGFAEVDHRFGDPRLCHFPLFDFLKPLPFQWMCLVYLVMWIGALGIMLGFFFKLSCLCFAVPYWYILLLDKTSWNNHSYLYGLLSLLLLTSSANNYWSLDAVFRPAIKNKPVPNWNYLLLKFQVFLLYFYAGVKKLDPEWLGGYSMKKLGNHWVFSPFRVFLTDDAVEFFLIHWCGFLLDLTIGFFLLWPKSRPLALFFGASFHVMNSQMFSIGLFSYVCLATLPVFCDDDWPKRWINTCPSLLRKCLPGGDGVQIKSNEEAPRSRLTLALILFYITTQLTLPWTHSLTQGYNNWTNGLYGYSWDMMVHAWETMHVVVSVKNKDTGRISYLDTEAFVRNDKWVGHADMVYQYARCVNDRLQAVNVTDVAIHVDVWRSLNGRFQQRLIDPRVDLLEAEWSPFEPTRWLMPLLTELSPWRDELAKLERAVFNWSDSASVAFVADFPGLTMENYIPVDVNNASIQVLDGQVELSFENSDKQIILKASETSPLPSGVLHLVKTTSERPACYMYTYFGLNATLAKRETVKSMNEFTVFTPLSKSLGLVGQSLLNLVFGIPLVTHK